MSDVTLKDLAKDINMDRSHARKFVKRLGIEFRRVRDSKSGNQLVLAVTDAEAQLIRSARAQAGFSGEAGTELEAVSGVFYIIRLVPELDPRRLKFGFAADLSTRLAQHRTAAPTASVVRSWPCRRSWESTVIDCLSGLCTLIASEVYEADSVDDVTRKADALFALMPSPDFRPPLSPYSPANT